MDQQTHDVVTQGVKSEQEELTKEKHLRQGSCEFTHPRGEELRWIETGEIGFLQPPEVVPIEVMLETVQEGQQPENQKRYEQKPAAQSISSQKTWRRIDRSAQRPEV
jgi:hypothetical protein